MFITVSFIDFMYGTCNLVKARQGIQKINKLQPSSRMFTYVVNNGFLLLSPVVHLSWM